MAQEETLYYRFLSEIRAFLSKLVKDPIKAEPSKYLKDRNFNKTKTINVLIKKGILERHEKILDSTNSEETKAKYVVKYKVKKENFEDKIKRIHSYYFEKNEPEKKKVDESFFKNEDEMKAKILNSPDGKVYQERGGIKECDCGGAMGGSCGATSDGNGGVTSTQTVGNYQYTPVAKGVIRRGGYNPKKETKHKPEDILGKSITAENKQRRIYITEKQFNMLMETAIANVGAETHRGDLGYDAPGFEASDEKFWKNSLQHNKKGGITCDRIDSDK